MSQPLCSILLQWGRDQLIAEINLRGGLMSGEWPLQWGRDQLIAEIVLPLPGEFALAGASMGPRSIDRGNTIYPASLFSHTRASMGPRSIDCGNRHLHHTPSEQIHASMG